MKNTQECKQEYTLKQAALMLGVHRDTMTYWEENKLVPPARRNPDNNYRVYNYDEVVEIARIRGIGAVDADAVIIEKQKQRKSRKDKLLQRKNEQDISSI